MYEYSYVSLFVCFILYVRDLLTIVRVIAQGVYIAFTSDIIPKLLWITQIPTWDKYINAGAATFLEFSLHNTTDIDNGQFCWCAYVHFSELESLVVLRWLMRVMTVSVNSQKLSLFCRSLWQLYTPLRFRYKGYTDGNGDISKFYWNMLTIKLAFVLGFVVCEYTLYNSTQCVIMIQWPMRHVLSF